nr:cytochrome P450 [Tanacetum cinerariifolium]
MHLLIELQDRNAVKNALSNTTLKAHFRTMKPWSNNIRIKNRVTWILVSGFPPQLRLIDSFNVVAEQWGKILIPKDCSTQQFNRSARKVCILTDHLEFIMAMMQIPKENEIITVRVSEVEGEIDTLFSGYVLDSSSNDDGYSSAHENNKDDGVCDNSINTYCLIVVVYSPQCIHKKKMLWTNRGRLVSNLNYLSIVLGDFNEVRSNVERKGSIFCQKGADLFNDFIVSSGLFDLPLRGMRYTHMDNMGSKLRKLGCFLISSHYIGIWPNSYSLAQLREFSDHIPILLKNFVADFGPPPFKFFNSWIGKKDFKPMVHDFWSRTDPHSNSNCSAASKSIINKLESIRRNFFWDGSLHSQKISWTAWKKVISPLKCEGLGIESLSSSNISLLSKWWWMFIMKATCFGVELFVLSMVLKVVFSTPKLLKVNLLAWYNIAKLRDDLQLRGIDLPSLFKIKIGNGEIAKFWPDKWLGGPSLSETFPRLYRLKVSKDVRVVNRSPRFSPFLVIFPTPMIQEPWHTAV